MPISDELDAYVAVHGRLDGLLRGSSGEAAVPSCPAWNVRDVVAHLTGLCEDWVAGDLGGYASDAWTAAQVTRFDGASLDAILDRWAAALTQFAALADDEVMGPPSRWAFGDAVTHEADIRGAIGAPRVPPDAVQLALKGSIGRWRQTLGAAEVPALLVQATGARDWWIGDSTRADAVTVAADAYDVFRALAGRRSERQAAAWSWSADPTPYLGAGLPYPFAWAAADLED